MYVRALEPSPLSVRVLLYKHMRLAEMCLHITETKIEKVKYGEADKTFSISVRPSGQEPMEDV